MWLERVWTSGVVLHSVPYILRVILEENLGGGARSHSCLHCCWVHISVLLCNHFYKMPPFVFFDRHCCIHYSLGNWLISSTACGCLGANFSVFLLSSGALILSFIRCYTWTAAFTLHNKISKPLPHFYQIILVQQSFSVPNSCYEAKNPC
jgi:hypothetical protein